VSGLAARIDATSFAIGLSLTDLHLWRPFQRALADPAKAQAALLQRILNDNADSAFGRRHKFPRIASLAEYRKAVPAATYSDLEPLIREQAETGAPALTAAPPIFYARTSGTVGAAKLAPVTAAGRHAMIVAQRLFACAQYRYTETFAGRVMAIVGSAVEDHTTRGVPIGAATGAIYAALPRAVRRRYVLPPTLFTVGDYDLRNYLIAMMALAAPDLSCMATANPSSLLRLHGLIEENWDALLDDLQAGRVAGLERLENGRAIMDCVKANPDRARALRRLGAGGAPRWAELWPGLKTVATWTGGSCGYALGALKAHMSGDVRVVDLGYQASECRGTVNIDPRRNACVPALTGTFFEFVERDARDAGGGDFLSLDELQEGREYYVFVTTLDGLYRYDMNDILRVGGRYSASPTLSFVQKGRGVTNITGEKLSEAQALAAVQAVATERGLGAPFFLLLADEQAAGYRLLVELDAPPLASGLAAAVDRALMEGNIEYASKRRSGRLGALEAVSLHPGAAAAYRRHCVARGRRDAQFKIMHLQYARELDFDFSNHDPGAGSV
jgi:hypothetical protein